LAWFYLLSVFVGSCTGVLGYGLTLADGTANLRGWQWIFLVMGLITQVVAMGAWWLVYYLNSELRDGMLTVVDPRLPGQSLEKRPTHRARGTIHQSTH
jgi:MFS family permease